MASASIELQDLILARLQSFAGVTAIVGQRVYDKAPDGAVFPYITFGPSDYLPEDADCITGREETFQIDIWHRDQGRIWPCKNTADAVKSALHEYDADIPSNALVEMRVSLVRVFEDPDGLTAHGVVQVTAMIEEQ